MTTLRPVVLYLLAILFIFTISFCRSPPSASTPAKHRRIGRQANNPHFAFDPLISVPEHDRRQPDSEDGSILDVASFKRKLQNAAGENSEGWSRMIKEIGVVEEYFGDRSRLNLTERLSYLFPLLDRFPEDGGISRYELRVWLQRQAMDRLFRQTERRMKMHDRNGDGEVSLREFLAYDTQEEMDWRNMEKGKPGWWIEQFSNADSDGSGVLNASEFNDFLHPEDSSNPKIILWLLNKKTREFDQNKDGELNLKEFKDAASEIYNTYAAFEVDSQNKNMQPDVEEHFKSLDLNKDGYLQPMELKPLIHHLYPGELSQAIYFAKYLMDKADENRDGKLTLPEMLHNQYVFYSIVYEDVSGGGDYEDDDYDYQHDEFRR